MIDIKKKKAKAIIADALAPATKSTASIPSLIREFPIPINRSAVRRGIDQKKKNVSVPTALQVVPTDIKQ